MHRVVVLLTIFCAGCFSAMVPPLAKNPVTGDVVVARADGETRYPFDSCVAGEHEMFYGFDLGSAADPRLNLRAVVDPIDGPAVKFTTAAGEFVLRARDCNDLRVDVRPTGWEINEYRDYAGSVVLDCRAGDAQIRANVSVGACH